VGDRAAEQRDAADEGRLEACGRAMVGKVIVDQGKVVRPSQLIAGVMPTRQPGGQETGPGDRIREGCSCE
jgi:hypothetical protein